MVERALEEIGIAFMMAPMHHPAIAHVMPTRAELATRTIFNILGPLTNPAGVKRQLTGVFSADLIRPMAETLMALGSEAAWLVHGTADGTDELTITGSSAVAALENGRVVDLEIHPEDAGLPVHPFEAILGGSPEDNGKAFAALLDGVPSAYRDAVLLNSAAALRIAGKAELPARRRRKGCRGDRQRSGKKQSYRLSRAHQRRMTIGLRNDRNYS